MLPVDPSTGIPTSISHLDSFTSLDTDFWDTIVNVGNTTLTLIGGQLLITNPGGATKGISYVRSKDRFGKVWRVSLDQKITSGAGEIALCLWMDSDNWVKWGPYKVGAVDCLAYLRYNIAGAAGAVAYIPDLTEDSYHTYTIGVLQDRVVFYCDGYRICELAMDLNGYYVQIEGGTENNADAVSAFATDFEPHNSFDPSYMEIGMMIRALYSTLVDSNTTISGNISLPSTTEVFLTFDQATYGNYFEVYLTANLKGCYLDECILNSASFGVTPFATSATSGIHEKFLLFSMGGATYAFQASSGYYMCAEGGGGAAVNINRSSAGAWEVFTRIDLGGGNVAFKTDDGTHYLTAVGGGGGVIDASGVAVGANQTFVETSLGGGFFSFRCAGGQYVGLHHSCLTDQTSQANSLNSNDISLVGVTPTVLDTIYFGNLVNFNRLDVYLEDGTSNTNNVFAWEYWNGSAWVALAVTDGTVYGGNVFGQSGSVTWVAALSLGYVYGVQAYWVRARVTTAGASLPKASHVQPSENGDTGFDSLAAFLSSLEVRIYRKVGGVYMSDPIDQSLPFTQCVLYKTVDIVKLLCYTDTKIGFKLTATPTGAITVPYVGFVRSV